MEIKTIILKSFSEAIQKERKAGEIDMTPGSLLKINSADEFILYDGSGAAAKCFAIENQLAGNGIFTPYSIGEQCFGQYFHSGEEVYAFVDASSTAVVIGDSLQAAAGGTLVKQTSGRAIAIALEASSTHIRIPIEAL